MGVAKATPSKRDYICGGGLGSPRSILGLLSDIGEDAAVYVKDMAVDEVRSVRGKEYCGTHEVFGSTPTSGRSLGDDKLVERMAASIRLDLAERSSLGSSDVARADAVALDVVLAEF